MLHSQVAIIGGGPGGYETAIRLAQYEISCIVIEKDNLGGICLNEGCIPTKALVKSAELYLEMLSADKFGLPKQAVEIDYAQILARKNAAVEQLTGGIKYIFNRRNIPVIKATATSVRKENGYYVIKTSEGESYSCEYLILATGSETAKLPGITIDEQNILSSTGILQMQELPEELVIVGGGVIGCEFASIFSAFGVKVTIVEFMPQLLIMEDSEISKRLTLQFKKRGVKILTNTGVQSIEKKNRQLELLLNNGNSLTTDKVLMSVGRKPLFNIKIENMELKTEKGAIVIDDFMQTNCDKVYAIGDVTGKLQLAHTSSKQGLLSAEHIAQRLYPERFLAPLKPINYINIPRCTFTHPEIASVGYTQENAESIYDDVIVGKFPFSANGKAVASGYPDGFVKIIARKTTSEIIGMHILGPSATELIAQGAIMTTNKMKIEDIDSVIFAHPTLSEAVMEAMEDLQNISIHKI